MLIASETPPPRGEGRTWSTGVLPRVRFRRFAAGTRKDLIEFLQLLFAEFDFQRSQAAVELFHGAGAGDGCRHDRVVEQPRKCNISRFLAPRLAQRFISAQLGAIFADLFLQFFAGRASLPDLLRDAA